MLQLRDNHIDVWLVFYREIVDASLLASMSAIMSDLERSRQARFHSAEDRKRVMVTRAMARTVLSYYAPVAPASWTFSNNDYGRPHIAHRHELPDRPIFNLSHTSGLIVMAVGCRRDLGIDVECLSTRSISPNIAEKFFSRSEIADLASCRPEQRQYRFLEYWTLKEAYIKARGMGLSIPLDKFSVSFPHEFGIDIAIEPEIHDSKSWSFWQYRPTGEHLLALCADRHQENPTHITLRKFIPLLGYEAFDAPLLKSSGLSSASPGGPI